ncbi:hypothetical protein [Paracoccus sp. M683]|uniref:hypothetical protein n=1 Tax=Paracoccus sp. M683 TaxID=2594268 RepID=UPI001C8F5B8F|nr:hypothetical protein [Paracoccus sp. M683]
MTIRQQELESRVLAGIQTKLMAPEFAGDAMKAYAEEMNRLNRERRSNGAAWRSELAKIEKDIRGIIEAIKAGMSHPSIKGEMNKLESRKVELTELLQNVPQDQPDILPAAAQIYARRVTELTEALNHSETQVESADQLRVLIEKIVLTLGPNRGEVYARLHGDLATILKWVARQDGKTGTKNKTPGAERSGVLVSVVAGTGFEPTTFRL